MNTSIASGVRLYLLVKMQASVRILLVVGEICVAANEAMRFSVRGFGCALFCYVEKCGIGYKSYYRTQTPACYPIVNLYVQLSEALIESQKEFDDAIKRETDQIIVLEDGFEKDMAIIKFNQKNYCLYLDIAAHNALEKLEVIEKNNRNK